MSDAFHREWENHNRFSEKLESGNIQKTDYEMLAKSYRKLLRQTEKIVIIGDASQHKLMRAQKMMERAIQRYRSTAEQKTELLGIISHELKNKAGAMKGLCEHMLEENPNLPEDDLETLQLITGCARDILNSTDSTLQRESQKEQSIIPVFEWTNIREILETDLKQLSGSAQKKNITINWKKSPELEAEVDPFLLGEVFNNLINNAVKFSPPGSQINIHLSDAENTFSFSVSDEGPGMSEEDLSKVFGKFCKLSAKPTGGESSTGLGLNIVKRLVDMHHGSVKAQSAGLGKGSTFTVTLPISQEK